MDDDERCTNHEIDVQNKAFLLDECVHSFKREMMGLMAGVQNSDAESFIVSFPDAVSDLMSSLEQLSESKRDCYRLFMDKQFSSVCKVMEDCLTNLEDMLSSGKPLERLLNPYMKVLKSLHDWIDIPAESTWREIYDSLLREKCFAVHIFSTHHVDCARFMSSKYQWLYPDKNILSHSSKLTLIRSLYAKDTNEVMPPVVIDRLQLLDDSAQKFSWCQHFQLRLNIQFKNEIAGGFGIAKEWLLIVTKQLFSVEQGLYKACGPNRRFIPNPLDFAAPELRIKQVKYFELSGKVISLAIKYKVPLGICFDRVFFLLLQGQDHINLEDIVETDEELYRGYKQLMNYS